MLKVQEYLRDNGLEKLVEDYKIVPTHHEKEPLVILNYDQIESPKTELFTHECRALTLDKRDWSIVARSFTRFFNYGEMAHLTSEFDWNQFEASSKEDGSLMVMYYWNGDWRVNTRGSFARGTICEGGPTWENLFWSLIDKKIVDNLLNRDYSFVFELCSPYNKIVTTYDKPKLFLLGIFSNKPNRLCDWPSPVVATIADELEVNCPTIRKFGDAQEVVDFLASSDLDATFEGYVLRDRSNMRLKVKNARYVALHHLRGNNGNLYLAKNLLPLILTGEAEETLVYFPEALDRYREFKKIVEEEESKLYKIWDEAKGIVSQKEFAQYIVPKTRLASILFDARKLGVSPQELWKSASDRILNILPRSS